jgi:ferredoxin
MRLEIDWTRCDGHGLCARLLPEQIHLDEHGFPVLGNRRVGAELLPHARRAVACCPTLALRLEQSVASHTVR